MPEPSNLEIVRRLYDEFLAVPERLASPALVEFFDPEVEIAQSASMLGTEGTFHGYEGLARSASELFAVFRDVHFVPKHLEARGDQVVATVESCARGRDSGAEVRASTLHTWTLRGGRIVRWDVHIDHADPEGSPAE